MSEREDAHRIRLLRAWGSPRSPDPPRPRPAERPEPGAIPKRRSWWGFGRSETREETVEVAVGVDSPTNLFVLRSCDVCGSSTWLAVERARALRVACRRCAGDLASGKRPERSPGAQGAQRSPVVRSPGSPPASPATRPATSPPTRPAPTLPDPKGDAERAGQLARFLRQEIEEGHRFLARFGPAEGVEERESAIRDWNETYSRNVEADVTETMMLAIPRRQGEGDAQYLARLKRTAERWRDRRARAIFPPTPAGVVPPPPGPPASQPTARKAGRKTD